MNYLLTVLAAAVQVASSCAAARGDDVLRAGIDRCCEDRERACSRSATQK